MILLAYIDPGTGLLVWQTVVAVALGVLFYVKKIRNWLLAPFRKLFRARKTPKQPALKLQPPANDAGR